MMKNENWKQVAAFHNKENEIFLNKDKNQPRIQTNIITHDF